MKKTNLTLKAFFMFSVLLTSKLNAQLSGVVTIDNTIPVSATNYTSFTALAGDLNTLGINNPLTVNVAATSTLYNEQVEFLQTPGISATNTITINGNGATISFNSTVTTLRHTLLLSGAD